MGMSPVPYVGKKGNKYQTCNDNYFLKMSKVVRRVVLPLLLVSIACRGEKTDRPVTVFFIQIHKLY